MAYVTTSEFYSLSVFDTTDINETSLEPILSLAQARVMADISVIHEYEKLIGDIDGSNTTFYTKYYPIADDDGDMTVDESDITVYGLTDKDDRTTAEELTVSSIDATTGKIELSEAPSTDYEVIVACYRSYNKEVDWTLVKQAVIYYASHLILMRNFALIPVTTRFGNLSIKHDKNLKYYWELYKQAIETLTGSMAWIGDREQLKFKDTIVDKKVTLE